MLGLTEIPLVYSTNYTVICFSGLEFSFVTFIYSVLLKPGRIQCHCNLSNCSGEKQCHLHMWLREANMEGEAKGKDSECHL